METHGTVTFIISSYVLLEVNTIWVQENQGNIIMSPFSVSSVMAMVRYKL